MSLLLSLALLLTPHPTGDTDPARVVSLAVTPERIEFERPYDSVQVLLQGTLDNGDVVDLTRQARPFLSAAVAAIDARGRVRPRADGRAQLDLRIGAHSVTVPISVMGQEKVHAPRFVTDVMPVLSRLGCNAGTCHGSATGKQGFKLSLRGYDPAYDHLVLTDDLAGRRFSRSSPEKSLFLLKPTASVPHEGGQRLLPGSQSYQLLRDWVRAGVPFDREAPRPVRIQVLPENPTVPMPGQSQQTAVLAHYADGSVRDVTAEAFVESSNTEVATVDEHGLARAIRRGETALMARYEGAYDVTRLYVRGDRSGFAWTDVPEFGEIDQHVYAKLRSIQVQPADLCSDAEFLRRVCLDLTGLPPTPRDTETFLLDRRDTQVKRREWIERLLGSPPFVEHWTHKWADLLQVNPKFLGDEGSRRFRDWIRQGVASNQPYDEFARELLSARGSTYDNPPASYYKILREPDLVMENTTQLFLGVRFNCNKCHDHPFERWTRPQHWQLAAYFGQVSRAKVEGGGGQRQAFEEIIGDATEGEVIDPDTGAVVAPSFPYEFGEALPEGASRRDLLTRWMTSAENPYFARSFVNRVWSYFFGLGIIDPVDDIRAGNPPSNPELLDWLTEDFVAHRFDVRHLMRTIVQSRTYQHGLATHPWNEDDDVNFSHALARRLPAEVLFDAVHQATGSRSAVPGRRRGTRAAELDPSVRLQDGFLDLFGRPPRESSCECERASGVSLGQTLALVNGPTVADALADPDSALADLARFEPDPRRLIEELFLSFLCRPPEEHEVAALLPSFDPSARANRAALSPADDAGFARRLSAWEARSQGARWVDLEVLEVRSLQKTKFQLLDDGSVLGPAEMPDTENLELLARTALGTITALRLEVLPDDSLPARGPGRAENGNFVLSELGLVAVPVSAPLRARTVGLGTASASFAQGSFPPSQVNDGNPQTGWAVSPRFGERHVAVWELAEDVVDPQGSVWVISVDQLYGGSHLLGRFRFAVTDSPRPVRASILPPDVERILATARDQRSAADQDRIHAHFVGTDPEVQAMLRLAATRDLAWALVNSAGFLFNR